MEVDERLRAVPTEGSTTPRADDEGKYVYCIIEADGQQTFPAMGIGGRGDQVYTIHHADLAAVVSDTPVVVYDPTRENALTHEHVIETVMKEFTVVQMSFGTMFCSEDDA